MQSVQTSRDEEDRAVGVRVPPRYQVRPLVGLVGFVGWIVLMINGFQGRYFKLPIVGDYAEKYADQVKL